MKRNQGLEGQVLGSFAECFSEMPKKDKTTWCSTVWSRFVHDSVGLKEEQLNLTMFLAIYIWSCLLKLSLLVKPSIADLQRLELLQFALSNCVPWATCGGVEGDVEAKWYNSVEGLSAGVDGIVERNAEHIENDENRCIYIYTLHCYMLCFWF